MADSIITRYQEALRPQLPEHARERDHSSRKWSVTWSDSKAVWTVTVVNPTYAIWYVQIANDGTEDYGAIRNAHLEAVNPVGVIAVLTGMGALPYPAIDDEESAVPAPAGHEGGQP